jgi:nickel/cobalt transporter (NicO) family protein
VKRLLIALSLFFVLAPPASAHPLGNFTVNRFARVEAAGDRVYVRYVLDLAEIPTFQDRGMRTGAYVQRIRSGLRLSVDGTSASFAPVARALAHPPGAGGLRTTRLEVVFRGPRIDAGARVDLRDTTYADRIGWKEIVVGDAASRSHELRAYPKDLLSSPLDMTHVATTLSPNHARRPALSSGRLLRAPDRVAASGFAALVDDRLSPGVVALALLLAVFWGAAHALSPGHGKAIVAGYLVGTRGTARHAALLGLTVTVTHTIGVFSLGFVTLALSQFVVPEQLYPWLNLASALLVVSVGLAVLRTRFSHARAHRHGHDHHHDHDHQHDHGYDGRLRGLLATGISGGILPCPTALVVLLAAISLHRVGYGLMLIVAFSLGLAAAITGIGLVAVGAKSFFSRRSFEGRLVRVLPTLSALVVLGLGVAMTFRALPPVV